MQKIYILLSNICENCRKDFLAQEALMHLFLQALFTLYYELPLVPPEGISICLSDIFPNVDDGFSPAARSRVSGICASLIQ